MQVGNLELTEGASIKNITLPSGTEFPANGNVGELFVLLPSKVVYSHDGTGWTVFGAPVQSVAGLTGAIAAPALKTALSLTAGDVGLATIVDDVAGKAASSHTQAASTISDSTTVGRAVLTAADAPAARTALSLGNASILNVAATGNAATTEVVKGNDTRLADARTPVAHNQAASTISDSTSVGRAVLTAADAAAARTAVGAAPIDSPVFTTDATVPALNGASPSGLANKIVNGCMRIPATIGASASIGLGITKYGAEGITAGIGGWSTFSGTIYQLNGIADARTSSGGLLQIAFGTATGSGGFIIYAFKLEAADAIQLANKPVTLSGRLTAGTTAVANHSLRVYKANAYNNFSTQTQLVSAYLGAFAADSPKDVSTTFTLAYNDCINGLEFQIAVDYNGIPVAPANLSLADFSCRIGSRMVPFEPRPVDLEKALAYKFTFPYGIATENINGGPASGFRNKIVNGCMRVGKKGSGAAVIGYNYFGADGITTFIGGWSAISATIAQEIAGADPRTSSGALHYIAVASATGASGYISSMARIEAADALELQRKTITVAARVTAWSKPIDNCYIRVSKATALNNFAALTNIADGAGVNVAVNESKDIYVTLSLAAADCANGLQVEVICGYTTPVTAAFHCFVGDFSCGIGDRMMPFEPRPIAIEELLRRRYYQKRVIRVPTSSTWTSIPIDMFKTPAISGGGAGFASTGTDKDTLICSQTTPAVQTIVLNSELM